METMKIDSAGERFGDVLAARALPRFVLRRSRYDAALATPTHLHPHPYFVLVVRGALSERGPFGRRHHGAGSLHFHPGEEPHSMEVGATDVTALSVALRGRLALRLEARPPAPAALDLPALRLMAERCNRELSATDSASDLALEGHCLELVASCLRREAPVVERNVPSWLLRARDYLHAHLDARVSLADLAAIAGVHETHLARTFRRHLGASPGAYVRRLRVERARVALATSRTPIADIALDAGFSSQSHFTRVFHRLVGAPPGAYRRRIGR